MTRLRLPAPPDSNLALQFRQLLEALRHRFVVLAFLDLHDWSEAALKNLQLFLWMALRSPHPLGLIVEWNVDLLHSAMQDFLALCDEFPGAVQIVQKDLEPEEAEALYLQAAQDRALPEAMRNKILDSSGGRPLLLLLEALRHALEGKDLSVPGNLKEASMLRARNLSKGAQRLLALIGVHSEGVLPSEARELFQSPAKSFEEALLELDSKGFLKARHARQPLLTLAQGSLRSSYLQALSTELIVKSHLRWMRRLEKIGGESQPLAAQLSLAEHALGAGERDLAMNIGLKAADRLSLQGQIAEATQLYQRLLPLANSAEERYVLQGSVAPLLYRIGRLDQALQAYQLWFQDRPDDETRLQKAKFCFFSGMVLLAQGKPIEAEASFGECLKIGEGHAYPSHRLYHVRSLAYLSALERTKGKEEASRALLEKALAIAAGDDALLGDVEQRLGELAQATLSFPSALEHFRKSSGHFETAGQNQARAVALQLMAMLHRDCGQLVEALDLAQQSVALTQSSGQILQGARYQENLALLFLDTGRYFNALEARETAQALLEVMGTPEDRALLQIHSATLYPRLGNLDRSQAIFLRLEAQKDALAKSGLWPSVLMARGEAACLYFQGEEAETFFTEAIVALQDGPKKLALLLAWIGLCRAKAFQGKLRPEDPHLNLALARLELLSGPCFEIWRRALVWLAEGAETTGEAQTLPALLESLRNLPLPELRLEFLALAALHLKRSGLERSASQLRENYRQELERLNHSLPEELKMDFEKHRNAQLLDQALSKKLESPASEPLPAALPTQPRTPQISEMRFRQYSEISRQISQKHDLPTLLERVMDAAVELTGAERGFLLLENQNPKSKPLAGFEVKTARGLSHKALQQEEFQVSLSAVRQVVEFGTSLLTSDAMLDPRLQEKTSVMQFQLKSILVVPLELEGKIIGTIYLDHRFHTGRFSEEDVVFLSAFAAQASLAIQKARMFEELQAAKRQLETEVKEQALHIEKITGELTQFRDQLKYGYEEMVGQSPPMMQVFQLLDHVTDTAIPVWIHGESGTGKELVARSLHYNSPRKSGPFVSENCSAIPETLLESELFGHKKGAFTHADRDRIGLFEQADKGTLFLDEVADMSLNMQAKLLRVLQEGEIRPLGSNRKIKVDVRLVTASNRDLEQMAKEEKFRGDLFFRLNGLTIRLPPLRDRIEDLPLLVEYIAKKICRDYKLPPAELTDAAFQALLRHPWPGNIRELEGVLRNALLFAKGRAIGPEFFSLVKGWQKSAPVPSPAGPPKESSQVEPAAQGDEEEKRLIIEALIKNRLSKPAAAKEIGVSLRSFYMRMERHGIPKNKPVLAKYLKERS